MRAEVKVGLIVGLVAIAGGTIWWFSGTENELGELTLDRRTMESASPGDVSLAGDVVGTPRQTTSPAPERRTDAVLTPPGASETERDEPMAITAPGDEPSEGVSPDIVPDGTEPPADLTTLTDAPVVTEAEIVDAGKIDSPPPAVEPPRRREPALAKHTERPRSTFGESGPPQRTTYTIQPGDRLIDIARDEYGDGDLWEAIKAINPDLDENRLQIDAKIEIPSRAEALRLTGETTAPARRASRPEAGIPRVGRATYIVGRGDTLTRIARNVLQDGSRWDEIFALNRDQLESADVIRPGMELRLPPLETKKPDGKAEKE
jgi:nucleoid-associated protein YgaU